MEMWAQLGAELCSQLMDALQSPRVAPFIPVPTDGRHSVPIGGSVHSGPDWWFHSFRSQLMGTIHSGPDWCLHSFRSQLLDSLQSQLWGPFAPIPPNYWLRSLRSQPMGTIWSQPMGAVHSGPNWWLRSFWSHPAPRFGVGHVGLRGRIPTAGEELEEQRPPQPVPQ